MGGGWVGLCTSRIVARKTAASFFIGPKDFQGKDSGAVNYDLLAEELHTHTYTGIANTQMFLLVSSSSSI